MYYTCSYQSIHLSDKTLSCIIYSMFVRRKSNLFLIPCRKFLRSILPTDWTTRARLVTHVKNKQMGMRSCTSGMDQKRGPISIRICTENEASTLVEKVVFDALLCNVSDCRTRRLQQVEASELQGSRRFPVGFLPYQQSELRERL